MKILTSKKLIYRFTGIRIFAIAFLFGIAGFWFWHWQIRTEEIQNTFIITFPPEPPKPESILQDRNISEYEQLNISNCGNRIKINYQKCSNQLDRDRTRILDNWKARKRTYIIYNCAGYHGETDYYLFIEPDDSGNWHVVQRWETYYTTVGWENLFKVSSTDAYFVQRLRKKENDDFNSDGKFYLKFFDKNGNRIDYL